MDRRKVGVILFCAALICLSNVNSGLAKEPPKQEEIKRSVALKELQGEITWVRKNKIAIVYKTDETGSADSEILLPVSPDVKLVHIQSMEQLKAGDVVSIQFEEATEESEGASKTARRAKTITFVKPGNKKPIEAAKPSEVLGSL